MKSSLKLWVLIGFGLIRVWSASAEGLHGIVSQLGAAALMVRGGDSLGKDDFPQVVTVQRIYEEYDPVRREWVEKSSICSGEVFNQSCVLLAAHCLNKPNQRTVRQEIFVGNRMRVHARLVNGQKKVLDVRPLATVTEGVARSPSSLDALEKYKSISRDDLKKLIAEDIAIVKLNQPLPAENSFTELNLPNPVTLRKGALATVVGSGHFGTMENEEDGTRTDEGAGTKRSGVVEIADTVAPNQPIIQVKAGPKSQLATFGDSGGPLLLDVEKGYYRAVVHGVVSTLDAEKTIHGTANDIVSTLFHKDWILATLRRYGCISPAERLTELAQKEFRGIGSYQSDWRNLKKWKSGPTLDQMKTLIRDLLLSQGELGKEFQSVVIQPEAPDLKNGIMRFSWTGRYSSNLADHEAIVAEEKLQGRSGDLPGGVIEIPMP